MFVYSVHQGTLFQKRQKNNEQNSKHGKWKYISFFCTLCHISNSQWHKNVMSVSIYKYDLTLILLGTSSTYGLIGLKNGISHRRYFLSLVGVSQK